jgi:hypothetical protein
VNFVRILKHMHKTAPKGAFCPKNNLLTLAGSIKIEFRAIIRVLRPTYSIQITIT